MIILCDETGLVRSAAQGFQDLVAFPLAALEARSPLQFITGLGFGSASLLRNLSGVVRSVYWALEKKAYKAR